jgi:hypothetical protein
VAPDTGRALPGADDELGFRLFAAMSGVAAWVLFSERGFHPVVQPGPVPMPILVPLAFAFVLALRPSSVGAFLGYWVTNTYHLFLGFPGNNTNQTLLFFVGLSIVVVAALRMVAARSVRVTGAELFRALSPVVRVGVFAIYFWTIFHKLNVDFVNPEVSCARRLGFGLANKIGLGGFPDQVAVVTVIMTILIEAALPLGLLFARTQRITALLGLGFHWTLGSVGFMGFSSTMMSLLTLFLAPHAGQLFSGYRRRVTLGPLEVPAATLNRLAFLGWILGLTVAKLGLAINPSWLGGGLWYGVPIFAGILVFWNRAPMPGGDPPAAVWQVIRRPTPALVVPLVLFLNGACPFLGTKTEYSYAMYSSLRTEGGRTNHLLWKTPLPLADYQTDLVEVLDGTDPGLFERYGGRKLPRYELTTALFELGRSGRAGVPVVLSDAAGTRTVANAERDLAREPTLLERKFLSFRKILPARKGMCAH